MKKLGEYIKWYFYITTSILLVTAVIFKIYNPETLPGNTLWQILLSGFLTTTVTVFIVFIDCKSFVQSLIKYLCHYAALCAIMIFCGKKFGWINLDLPGTAMMAGAVAVVYLLSLGAYYIIDLRQADLINKRLKEKYEEESE